MEQIDQKEVQQLDVTTNIPITGKSVDPGNIDKIRHLLFGAQMRDYDKRFVRLEERITAESSTLHNEINNRLNSLESFIKQELTELHKQVGQERADKDAMRKQLLRSLEKLAAETELKRVQIEDRVSKGQSILREGLLEQSKLLRNELQTMRSTMLDLLERNSAELRDDKTDRKALAAMFTEMAMRLNEEFEIPGDDLFQN